ncbi:hypothetical protein [Burkholderia multivorans]|uniref:hypothetical protein n=1 Tax=Burkholderia multivorans TaxID=87883 RepID=UPI0011858A57|nr:hypothetical protein [Burkholderia multivorans]
MLSYFTAPKFKNFARDAGKPLAVMHVPKTAGTSVITGISDALQSPVDVWGCDRMLLGAFDKFSEFGDDVAKTIYSDPGKMPDAKLVMGHFSRSTLVGRYPNAQLLTFIREPLTRLLSHWVYWRCTPDDHLAHWGSWRECVEVSRGSLKAFLTDPRIACQTDNIVTRMLLWPDARCGNDTFIHPNDDSTVLKDALRRLDSFAYTDIIENPSFRSTLSEWLGASLPMNHLNPTARVPPDLRLRLDKELDPETMSLLDARCRLDYELWRTLAKYRLKNVDAYMLQRQTVIQAFSRYGALLAP